jgi:hypothetical protein
MRLCRRAVSAAVPALAILFGDTAVFATFWSRVTAFLEERLIGSGEGKILPAVAASKLNIAGHGDLVQMYCQLYHCFSIISVIFGF